ELGSGAVALPQRREPRLEGGPQPGLERGWQPEAGPAGPAPLAGAARQGLVHAAAGAPQRARRHSRRHPLVGIAGVSLDAAENAKGDKGVAKKLGVFGYDRVTHTNDITDGREQTIALLLTSGDHKSPWLAGGGAPVRGVADVDEDARPLAPFICVD